MVRSTIWFAALVLGAGLLAPSMLHAQARSARTVQDDAGLFSKDAIARANGDIAQIKSKHSKDLFIETLKEGPKSGQAAWARTRAKNANVNGIYLVFTAEPKHFEVAVGNKTREKLFTSSNIDHLVDILKTHMAKDRDAALQKSAAYVLDAMNANARTGGAPKAAANGPDEDGFFNDAPANPAAHRSTSSMSPWVGYALLIGGVLLVGWLLMAVFRGIGSMAGGGGGGGGFMTGMLGGLFGAMAGMWIYNSFFGGSHAHAADPSSGADTDYGSTGGDYGNDAGGDDFGDKGGGGGGDWGGGGDAGGGGDFGGGGFGGGDFGGGGGGDW